MSGDLSGLGQRVAAVQDRQVASLRAAEKAREGFLGAGVLRRRRSSPGPLLAALVAAAFAGAVATFVALGPLERALAFSVGAEPFACVAGREVTAPDDRPVPVHFSDGSELSIEPLGRLVVTAVDRAGAVAELERGRASVRVVHRAGTRWALHAGPYTVDVVGTRFEIEWRPESAHLLVRLEEGRVVVKGGNLASPVPVEAGQALVAADGTWKLTPAAIEPSPSLPPRPDPTAAPGNGGSAPAPVEGSVRGEPRTELLATAKPAPERPAPPRRWQELAQAGNYDDAMAAVEREGFDAACHSAPASDLMTLAETARLGKRPARARQALAALRDRFPGDAQAAAAAFYLGRMAGDREAAEWFRTYLREAPGGALRREASGRLLEALSRGGDTAAAAEAARSYLKQYPHGPHASLAARLAPP